MAALLFAYGTLRDPELLEAVLGRTALGRLAAAPGFAAVHYPGRVYPALVRRAGSAATGLLLTDLSAFELEVLDAFEGDEYRRGIVPVVVDEELHEAFAYLPAAAIAQDAPDWTLRAWQASHKPLVLAGERAAAAELRSRLLAKRLH